MRRAVVFIGATLVLVVLGLFLASYLIEPREDKAQSTDAGMVADARREHPSPLEYPDSVDPGRKPPNTHPRTKSATAAENDNRPHDDTAGVFTGNNPALDGLEVADGDPGAL